MAFLREFEAENLDFERKFGARRFGSDRNRSGVAARRRFARNEERNPNAFRDLRFQLERRFFEENVRRVERRLANDDIVGARRVFGNGNRSDRAEANVRRGDFSAVGVSQIGNGERKARDVGVGAQAELARLVFVASGAQNERGGVGGGGIAENFQMRVDRPNPNGGRFGGGTRRGDGEERRG